MKVELTLSIGMREKRVETVDIPEIDEMSPEERRIYVDEYWKEWIFNYIDGGANIVEE